MTEIVELENGGFEADWGEQESNMCLVIPKDGDPFYKNVGEICSPPHWIFWFYHDPGAYDQPEGRDAWKKDTPERVRSGEKAYMWFTFNRSHDAGLFQQVEVGDGSLVRFFAHACAWSNQEDKNLYKCWKCHRGVEIGDSDYAECWNCGTPLNKDVELCFPHPEDGRWSEGAGYDVVAWPEGTCPHNTGIQQEDAKPNFTFWVGIDPTGGTNPLADTVVWGEGYHIYNGYAKELEVEAVAEADVVTVFIRSKTLWGFKHNDAYIDDAKIKVTAPEEPPEEEPRGKPRVQYERTYVLLPPDADRAWARAVVEATWDDEHYTVGSSADDAGIGDLDARRVIAVNPQKWEENSTMTLLDFFETYYKGCGYVPIEAATPADLITELENLNPNPGPQGDSILLGMKDDPWGPMRYGDGCPTFASNGCWLTCCAMALRKLGIDPDATPLTVDEAVGPSGYTDCSMRWDAMPRIGLEVIESTADLDKVRAHLAAGNVAFADVFLDESKHFVMLTRSEGDDFSMYDPLKRVAGLLSSYYPNGIDDYRLVQKYSPPAPEFTRRGVHDLAGAEWLVGQGLSGWCVEPVYLGLNPRKIDGLERLAENNIRVLLNLRYSWATGGKDGGGEGTLPAWDDIGAFVDACAETMRLNPAAWGFVLANEFNNPREWHRDSIITPEMYAQFYNMVYVRKPKDARVMPGAIDPYNAQAAAWGDWRKTWRWVLDNILGAEGLTFHCYTHGPELWRIRSTQQFEHPPFLGIYFDMMVLKNQQAIVPARFAGLPQIVTETNPDADGVAGWPNDGAWIVKADEFFEECGVAGWCSFRYNHNDWRYGDKPNVLEAIKDI
jgi:hypothetical protein